MDSGRLKTIVLLILLGVNLAFAGILLSERADSAELASQQRTELIAVFSSLGIEIGAEEIPDSAALPGGTILRDTEKEAAFVRALLGDVQARDQGGNIWYYENENGWAWCRGGGNFEIMVFSGLGSLEDALSRGGLQFRREEDNYLCLSGDTAVFNCRFSLSQRAGGVYISGRFLLGQPQSEESTREADVSTLLLRFYDRIRDSGGIFSRVEGIQPGYVLGFSASGMELIPVWQIATDGGAWYYDYREDRLLTVSG